MLILSTNIQIYQRSYQLIDKSKGLRNKKKLKKKIEKDSETKKIEKGSNI